MSGADEDAGSGGDGRLRISVARSGGLAGLRRQWSVEPAPPEQPEWTSLVEACPWDSPPSAEERGGDRYVWQIEVLVVSVEHRVSVPEAQLDGPWRRLVERVRAEGSRG